MKALIYGVIAILLLGCQSTHSPVSEGYKGETARLEDSFSNASRTSAHFFVVSKVDGKAITDSASFSENSSEGQGRLVLRGISRPLEANKKYTLTLVGRTAVSAPIVGMFSDTYLITGDVSLTPKANEFYTVVGTLGESKSQIWVEDLSGNRVSDIVEKTGDSTRVITDLPAPVPPKDRKALYTSIRGGESVAQVVKKLGEPDSITVEEGSTFKGRPTQIIYHYPELGQIFFSGFKNKTWQASSVLRVQIALQSKEDMNELQDKLEYMSAQDLKTMAKSFASQPEVSESFLDTFTQKIWDERANPDGQMIDAMAWLCKVIGNSSNRRYEQALSKIAMDTPSPKLKKYALKAKERLTQGSPGFELTP